MGYFSNFKQLSYDLNGDGVQDKIVNLTSLVVASPKLLDKSTFYNFVEVRDGERPDQ